MSLEIILNIEPLDIHIKKLGLIAYKSLKTKLDKVTWCTDPTKSHLQYWAQDLHSVITKNIDDRCDTTIYDRYTTINTDSFDGKPIHIQKAETTIYTIDKTLSWNLKTELTNWKVLKELNHSDHNTIKFNLETEMETIPVHRPWTKADWLTFKAELEHKEIYIPNKITPHRLEKMLDQRRVS